MSYEEYMYSKEKWKRLYVPEPSCIPCPDHVTTASLHTLIREVLASELQVIRANPSGSDSKRARASEPAPLLPAKPKVKSAKKNTAAVAAGAGENVDTGTIRRKKRKRSPPADESVKPPKHRKSSRRSEEEQPAGEDSGNEVQRDKK